MMSLHDELALMKHEDLVELSNLVYKLLKWDNMLSWEQALQQAYDTVVEERDWLKNVTPTHYSSV